jgi:hypothetical protein
MDPPGEEEAFLIVVVLNARLESKPTQLRVVRQFCESGCIAAVDTLIKTYTFECPSTLARAQAESLQREQDRCFPPSTTCLVLLKELEFWLLSDGLPCEEAAQRAEAEPTQNNFRQACSGGLKPPRQGSGPTRGLGKRLPMLLDRASYHPLLARHPPTLFARQPFAPRNGSVVSTPWWMPDALRGGLTFAQASHIGSDAWE